MSTATKEVAADALPPGVMIAEVGSVRLDGFDNRERVHQLCHPDLPAGIRTLRRPSSTGIGSWPTALVGRVSEREEVAALLAQNRLVTIAGAGGAGKTRLAYAVGEDIAADYPDGVAWVDLARLSDGVQVPSAVAAACGLREVPGAATMDLLTRALAETRTLIVLDNCEHLLDACAQATDALLRAAPHIRVLATAREPLGVAGEVTWRIPPLALPPEGERDLERVGAFDAVRLFVARARAAAPTFRLAADNATTVARICRRLDGLPLALELAAARVRALSVDRLADALDDRFRLLTGGARTAVARQRTLLASIEWSHDLLDESERVSFRRLGVFVAPFDLDAAEAIAAGDDLDPRDVRDVLARLVDKSLVQHLGDRYRLLESLRQFALERAGDAGELAALRTRHLAWFRRRAATWRLDRELATFAVLEEVDADAPDLAAALEWSLEAQRAPAVELLYALVQYWGSRRAYDDLRALSGRVLAPLEEGTPTWLEALAPMAAELLFTMEIGWMPAARRALDAPDTRVSPDVRGFLDEALSLAMAFQGMPEGLAGLERAADAGRAIGNSVVELESLLALTSFLAAQGERPRVQRLVQWLDRRVPADARMGFLLDLAHASTALHDCDFATARSRLAIHLARPSCEFAVATNAGLVALYTEDAALARRAVAGGESNVVFGAFASSMAWLRAIVPLIEGDLDAATRCLESEGSAPTIATAAFPLRCMAAEIALAHGGWRRAAALLDEIEPGIATTFFHHYAATVHLLRAHVARAAAQPREAETRTHRALELAAEHELQVVATDALETLAVLAADVDEIANAGRLLGAADGFRERTGYRWIHPHRRADLDAIRERIDPAHRAEGAALSLAEAIAWARRGRGERRPTVST